MLPFLKPQRKDAGVIVSTRLPDGGAKMDHQEGHELDGVKAAAADLIRAVHAKDESAVASALKAAFEILDSMPHDEGEHTNDEQSK
jgi:hypothetical protein